MTTKQARYNIAIIGKTGVGKSSLINRLIGKELAKEGAGKPVTERGFYQYDATINKIPVTLIDSWGLEVGHAEEWKQKFEEEVKSRTADKPVAEWFHSVIYCVGAGGSRVEQFEIDILKHLILEGNRVVVAFTKCDQVSCETIEALKSAINLDDVYYQPVCCVEQIDMMGRPSVIFGIDKIEEMMVDSFWDVIGMRMPTRCLKVIHDWIQYWVDEKKEEGRKAISVNGFGVKKYSEKLEKDVNSLFQDIDIIIPELIKEELNATIHLFEGFTHVFSNFNKTADIVFVDLKSPKLDEAGRYILGFFAHLFSLLLVGIPLMGVLKKKAITDLDKFIDDFGKEVFNAVKSQEEKISKSIRDAVKQLRSAE